MPEVHDLGREAVVQPRPVPLDVPFSSFNAVCDQRKTPVMDTNQPIIPQTQLHLIRPESIAVISPPRAAETRLTNVHKIFVLVVFLCEARRSLATT